MADIWTSNQTEINSIYEHYIMELEESQLKMKKFLEEVSFLMEKSIIRIYKPEEIKAMNKMFEKENGNCIFTKRELEFANKIDLFDECEIEIASIVWKYKDNTKALKQIADVFRANGVTELNNIIGGIQ